MNLFYLLIMVKIYIMACGRCDNGNEGFDRKSNNQIKIMLNYKRYNKKTMSGESINGWDHKERHTFIFRTHQTLEKYRKHIKKGF